MSKQGFVETPLTQQADSTALTNTTTATSILTTPARLLIPANSWEIGKTYRVRAAGRISTLVTAPGTLTLDLRVGPSIPATIVAATTGALALNVVAQTNATWDLEWLLTCRAIGNAALTTLMHVAKWTSRASLNAPAVGTTTGVGVVLAPDTAPAVGTGFDATVNNYIDLFGTWSVANAANSILTHLFAVESLN